MDGHWNEVASLLARVVFKDHERELRVAVPAQLDEVVKPNPPRHGVRKVRPQTRPVKEPRLSHADKETEDRQRRPDLEFERCVAELGQTPRALLDSKEAHTKRLQHKVLLEKIQAGKANGGQSRKQVIGVLRRVGNVGSHSSGLSRSVDVCKGFG
eukprot:Amastigsp_a510538_43.p3 type:complete len:155 gc:universal Amastigsp_a510538_43:496-32(-)